jgi:hypothetical protein
MFMIIYLFINHLVVEYATTQDHKKTAMDSNDEETELAPNDMIKLLFLK